MEKVPPSEKKSEQIAALLQGGRADGGVQLSELIRLSVEKTVQELLEAEQSEYLGRERYERTAPDSAAGPERRNGYSPKRLRTAEGVMEVAVPQVRGGEMPYRSRLLGQLQTKSEVLQAMVVEMYARGLSVRDIEASLSDAMGRFVLSDTSVSVITDRLIAEYEAFRTRRLDGFDVAYLYLDAVYEPLKRYGCTTAVVCTWARLVDGAAVLIDLRTGNGESTEATLAILRDLVSRGLQTPLTVTSDGAAGVTQAIDVMWPTSKRIRCWVHKMRNLKDKCPPERWAAIKAQLSDIRDAPTVEDGHHRLDAFVAQHERTFPELCRCLQTDRQATLNHLHVPHRHRIYVRTTNLVERSFVEERRRTKITGHLWDETRLVKLVFAVLMRVSDRWSKRQFSPLEERTLCRLRDQWGLASHTQQPNVPLKPKSRRSAGGAVAA